jgi:hypothetical protein
MAIVTEIRDSIEVVHSAEYPKFLGMILPAFLNLLSTVKPSFKSDALEHVIRLAKL